MDEIFTTYFRLMVIYNWIDYIKIQTSPDKLSLDKVPESVTSLV